MLARTKTKKVAETFNQTDVNKNKNQKSNRDIRSDWCQQEQKHKSSRDILLRLMSARTETKKVAEACAIFDRSEQTRWENQQKTKKNKNILRHKGVVCLEILLLFGFIVFGFLDVFFIIRRD